MSMSRLVSALALAGVLLLTACGQPLTQVLLVIDSDMDVPAELDQIRVDLIGPDGSLKRSEGRIDDAGQLPRTLAIVHTPGSALGPVQVTVTGLQAGRNVVQRRATFDFVDGEVRILRVDLLDKCVGIGCAATETCADEGCRSVEVAESELVPYDESLVSRLDAGAPIDGDVAPDGGCLPAIEICNGADDDCDGDTDEDFDLTTDMLNCGACGTACPVSPDNGASACEASSCALRCDLNFADCDDDVSTGCEAPLSVAATCGSCELTCSGSTPLCEESDAGFGCVGACAAGTMECSGACVDTNSSPLNCGSCGNRCTAPANAIARCAAGGCTFECDAGFSNCDGNPANGCESNLKELTNCGACGARCERAGATASCATGSCALVACLPLRGNCDGDNANGCERDLSTDEMRCGTCTTVCPASVTAGSVECVAGSCALACDPGFASCDSMIANGCETNLSASTSCGACGVACLPAELCASASGGGYACTSSCTSGTVCSMSCVDTASDVSNCGGCGTVCTAGAHATPTCTASTCGSTCNSGWFDCDSSPASCETRTADDVANCGTCGNVCPTRANAISTCTTGTCGLACAMGFADCNRDPADGCEANLQTSTSNCGSCGAPCTPGPGVTSVGCSAGVCTITACSGTLASCDATFATGCEADLQTNKQNCGVCGNFCIGPRRCCSGTCEVGGGMCP